MDVGHPRPSVTSVRAACSVRAAAPVAAGSGRPEPSESTSVFGNSCTLTRFAVRRAGGVPLCVFFALVFLLVLLTVDGSVHMRWVNEGRDPNESPANKWDPCSPPPKKRAGLLSRAGAVFRHGSFLASTRIVARPLSWIIRAPSKHHESTITAPSEHHHNTITAKWRVLMLHRQEQLPAVEELGAAVQGDERLHAGGCRLGGAAETQLRQKLSCGRKRCVDLWVTAVLDSEAPHGENLLGAERGACTLCSGAPRPARMRCGQ
jgi:hypothetical protein